MTFVKEQIKVEAFTLELIDEIEIAGGVDAPKAALYNINQELKKHLRLKML